MLFNRLWGLPLPAKTLIIVSLLPILMSWMTGFGIKMVAAPFYFAYYILLLYMACLGVVIGSKLKIFSQLAFIRLSSDSVFRNKILLLLLMMIQFIYLCHLLYNSKYFDSLFFDRLQALLNLDFYRLRYVLLDRQYAPRVDDNKTMVIIAKFLPNLLFTKIFPVFNGITAHRYPLSFNKKTVSISLTAVLNYVNILILLSYSVLGGSRTLFVTTVVIFMVGYFSVVNQNYLKADNLKLVNSKKHRIRIFKIRILSNFGFAIKLNVLAILVFITFSLFIIGKITYDRVGRFDGKIWLARYENNMLGDVSTCNNLCSNPLIAGLTGYTVGPYLMSKSQFDLHYTTEIDFDEYGAGYKSYWFINRIFSILPIPFVKDFSIQSKEIYQSSLVKYVKKNNLKLSIWRGLAHDYIFDWGILMSLPMIIPPYILVGSLYNKGNTSNSFIARLYCQGLAIIACILSIAIQPFGPILPFLLIGLIL